VSLHFVPVHTFGGAVSWPAATFRHRTLRFHRFSPDVGSNTAGSVAPPPGTATRHPMFFTASRRGHHSRGAQGTPRHHPLGPPVGAIDDGGGRTVSSCSCDGEPRCRSGSRRDIYASTSIGALPSRRRRSPCPSNSSSTRARPSVRPESRRRRVFTADEDGRRVSRQESGRGPLGRRGATTLQPSVAASAAIGLMRSTRGAA